MKKALLLFVISILIFPSLAQDEEKEEEHWITTKDNIFGFFIGPSFSRISVEKAELSHTSPKKLLSHSNNTGVYLGCFGEFRVNDPLFFRIQPSFFFVENSFEFSRQTLSMQQIIAQAPIHMIYKKTFKKYAPYIYVGSTFKYDFAADGETNKLDWSQIDLTLDMGIGLDHLLDFFIFSPEIKFSYSPINLVLCSDSQFSNSMNSMHVHSISFVLNFKG